MIVVVVVDISLLTKKDRKRTLVDQEE